MNSHVRIQRKYKTESEIIDTENRPDIWHRNRYGGVQQNPLIARYRNERKYCLTNEMQIFQRVQHVDENMLDRVLVHLHR